MATFGVLQSELSGGKAPDPSRRERRRAAGWRAEQRRGRAG